MTRHTRLAMLLASAAAAYGAEATRPHAVTKRGAFVSSAVVGGAEICDACVQGFGVVEAAAAVIAHEGSKAACGELCSNVPAKDQTSCDFVCELVGPAALFALAEKGDINPTAICADIHACLPVSGGVAEVVSSMVAPLQLRAGEGAKVTIELDINVTKPAGTGQYIVGVNYVQYPSGGQKHINQNFYELDEGVSKFKVVLDTSMCWYCDDTSEDLHEGEYNVYAAVCEGGDCTPEGGARKGSNVVASKNMGQFSIQP